MHLYFTQTSFIEIIHDTNPELAHANGFHSLEQHLQFKNIIEDLLSWILEQQPRALYLIKRTRSQYLNLQICTSGAIIYLFQNANDHIPFSNCSGTENASASGTSPPVKTSSENGRVSAIRGSLRRGSSSSAFIVPEFEENMQMTSFKDKWSACSITTCWHELPLNHWFYVYPVINEVVVRIKIVEKNEML